MSTPKPTVEMVACPSCGEEIPNNVRICRACKFYTKTWKNSLTYFGQIAGVIAIVASGGTFMAGQAAEWYRTLTWRDQVRVVFFEYPGRSGFLNVGSGNVVLESVLITWPGEPGRSIMIPVNIPVAKGEFVPFAAASPFGRPQNEDTGEWAASRDGAAPPKLLSEAIDRGKKDRCAEYHFHNADHVVFQRIAALQQDRKLISVAADAQLNFISLHTGQPISVPVPNITTSFLYFSANTGCAKLASG